MMNSQAVIVFLMFAMLQNILIASSKPAPQCGYPCSYASGCGGNFGCGSIPICPSPPIQFQPIPQPIPIKCSTQKQSVTIPNIILALLPPNNKCNQPCGQSCALPYTRPAPVVLPLPQPYAVPISSCTTGCNSCC